MKDRSDNLTFELAHLESSVMFAGEPEAPFGNQVGDITKMNAVCLMAGAVSARMCFALPALQATKYRPVRLRKLPRRS